MSLLIKIQKYSNTVCEQIRWKKAHPVIALEIENHILDQRDAYLAAGDDEKTATDKAILQMGDAVSVGVELDKTHRPKPQWSLIGLTGILMLIGMITHYIIDASQISYLHFSIVPYFMAACIFLVCYHADFTMLGEHPFKSYLAVTVISLLAVLFGTKINGNRTWYRGEFSTSLSYLSLIFPLTFALIVYSMRNNGYRGILLSGLGFLPLAIVLSLIPTISGLFLFALSSLAILCFAIAKGWFGVNKKRGLSLVFFPVLILAVSTLIYLFQKAPHTSGRIATFLNPYTDRFGAGYVYCLIRDFLSKSIIFGKGGIPDTATAITQLPGIATDYPLVYMVHQFGFFVLLIVIACLTLFSGLGIYKAMKQTSILGSLISLSVLLTFVLQSAFYVIDNLGYGLFSSLSLPFISYGKSALFINAALTGFMLSVFRTGSIYKDNLAPSSKSRLMFSYQDGKLIIDLKGIGTK